MSGCCRCLHFVVYFRSTNWLCIELRKKSRYTLMHIKCMYIKIYRGAGDEEDEDDDDIHNTKETE